MKDVIITGATGMIGSHVAKNLMERGINVTAIVRPMSEKLRNLEWAEREAGVACIANNENNTEVGKLRVVECGLWDLPTLRDKLGWEHDALFHFGWGFTFGPGRNDAAKQESNVRAAIDAVHLAYEAGCKTFVGAGSQAEFGIVTGTLSDELKKEPVTGYGIAKLAAGRLTALECRNLGMKHNWARILSCYGPGDNDYTMVMSAVRAMMKGERMQFTPAKQVWDYIYADDCAKAFIAIAEKGIDQKSYMIGSGTNKLLKDYIYAIRDAINPELEVGIGERDYNPDQVMHLVADISDLVNDTGYKPTTPFEEGIKQTVEWAKENP
ncbi:MAG: NAD(P)-dependent oxidoreductase [Eubacterium sp.]|nr:NAD(P)-dependent oxidoreductase [Eubacterium sp.]